MNLILQVIIQYKVLCSGLNSCFVVGLETIVKDLTLLIEMRDPLPIPCICIWRKVSTSYLLGWLPTNHSVYQIWLDCLGTKVHCLKWAWTELWMALLLASHGAITESYSETSVTHFCFSIGYGCPTENILLHVCALNSLWN